jgi:hypothetical protein
MPKLYYCHTGLVKNNWSKKQQKIPSQNGWVQINLSKMALKSSWTWGQKYHMGVFLYWNSQSKNSQLFIGNVNIPNKEEWFGACISINVQTIEHPKKDNIKRRIKQTLVRCIIY